MIPLHNLKSYFSFGKADDAEILTILSGAGGTTVFQTGRQVIHVLDTGNWFDVTFSKAGRVTSVTANDPMTDEMLEGYRQRVQEKLVDGQVPRVGWLLAFSSHKVEHVYDGGDFVIRPLPEGALQLDGLMGDHPFLLGVTFTSCPDVMMARSRKMRRAVEVVRFLNLFLRQTVHVIDSYSKRAWVHRQREDGSMESEWLELGYWHIWPEDSDSFGELAEGPPMPEIEPKEYYGEKFGRPTDEPMVVVADIGGMIRDAFALKSRKPRAYDQLWRAVTWIALSENVWIASPSSCYIALASAIESLLDTVKEKCPTCSQPTYSVTQQFADFLDTHAPLALEPDSSSMPSRKYLYHTRSGLAHGTNLLRADLEPWHFMSSQPASDERAQSEDLFRSAKRATINWLFKQVGRDPIVGPTTRREPVS